MDLKDKWRNMLREAANPLAVRRRATADTAGLPPSARSLPSQMHFRGAPPAGAPRRHVTWTPQEEALLCRGVKEFGAGHWTDMLQQLNGFHESRTCAPAPPHSPARAPAGGGGCRRLLRSGARRSSSGGVA